MGAIHADRMKEHIAITNKSTVRLSICQADQNDDMPLLRRNIVKTRLRETLSRLDLGAYQACENESDRVSAFDPKLFWVSEPIQDI